MGAFSELFQREQRVKRADRWLAQQQQRQQHVPSAPGSYLTEPANARYLV